MGTDTVSDRQTLETRIAGWARRSIIASLLAVFVGIVAVFADFGITWDEHIQQVYGERLLKFYGSSFADTSAFQLDNLYLYGGLFDMTAAAAAAILPFDTYNSRHLVCGLFGLFGLLGIWKLVGEVASHRAAVLAIILLATSPLMIGHSFTNPKDAPFAWLSVWACYYICRAMREAPGVRLQTIIGLGVALGAVMGQRVIGGHLIIWVLVAIGAWPFIDRRAATRAGALVKAGLLAAPVALLVMAFFWPWSARAPENLFLALTQFSQFPYVIQFPWAGTMVTSTELPAWYLPRLFLVQLSDATLLAVAVACVGFATSLQFGSANRTSLPHIRPALLFLALTAIGPVVIAMATGPTLYNGLRHFLFVVPIVSVLAGIGFDRWMTASRDGPGRSAAAGLLAALALLIALSVIDVVRLHPYQYVAFNRISGGIDAAKGRDELDYWGASLTQLARDVRADATLIGQTNIKTFVCGRQEATAHVLGDRFEIVNDLSVADVYLGIDERSCADRYRPAGRLISDVRRNGVVLGAAYQLK